MIWSCEESSSTYVEAYLECIKHAIFLPPGSIVQAFIPFFSEIRPVCIMREPIFYSSNPSVGVFDGDTV